MATDDEGRVDREKVHNALLLTPDAPETWLVDIFLADLDLYHKWRSDAQENETSLLATSRRCYHAQALTIQHQIDQVSAVSARLSSRLTMMCGACGFVVGVALTWAFIEAMKIRG
jgi:hypothetical protein